jgi:hypothetical protein
MGSGATLRVTNTKNLPRTVKIALRTRDKDAQSQKELLKWNTHINLGLHWSLLDKDLSFLLTGTPTQSLWKVDIRFFAGLSHGTIKVLRDCGAKPQQGKGAVSDPVSLETTSEGRGFADVPTPSESREEQKGEGECR